MATSSKPAAALRRSAHYSLARVKASLMHFAAGKVATGAIGLLILLLVVRHLQPDEFGLYVTFVALLEVVVLVSSFGLLSLVQRYLPDYRLRGSAAQVRALIYALCAGRLATLAGACGLLAALAPALTGFLQVPQASSLLQLYLLVVAIEGCARYLDAIFESLLVQGYGQIALIVRNGFKLAGILALLAQDSALTLEALVRVEIVACLCGLAVGLVLLAAYVQREKRDENASAHSFDRRKMAHFSFNSYLSMVLGQVYGLETLKLVVTRMLGVIETATYGFAQSIADILRRYLPAQLMLGLVRPLLVARHAGGAGLTEINGLCNLLFKFNLFCLAPVMVFFGAYGAQFVALFTGGKYEHAHGLIFGMCMWLVMHALHVVLALMAMTFERGDASLSGTLAGAVGLACAILLAVPYGPYGVLAGAYVSEIAWCAVVWWRLRHAGWHFRFDLDGNARIVLAALVASGVLALARPFPATLKYLVLAGISCLVAFALVCAVTRPFTAEERAFINRFLPRPVFVW